MVIFVEDGLGGGSNSIQAKTNSLRVNAEFLKFDFVINEIRSLWESVQNIIWLGIVLDTNQGFISVIESGIAKIVKEWYRFYSQGRLYDCQGENSCRGCRPDCIINSLCVGDVTRIITKAAYAELVFWNQNVDCLNCRFPWLSPCINLFTPTRQIMPVDPLSKMKTKFFTKIGHLPRGRKAQQGGS